MERHERHLEAEPGEGEERPGHEERLAGDLGQVRRDRVHVGEPGHPVKVGEAEEHRRRRGRADEEILERALRRAAVLRQRDEKITRERDELEEHVDEDEIGRPGERRGREDERGDEEVPLPLVPGGEREPAKREGEGARAGREDDHLHERTEPVDREGREDAHRGLPGRPRVGEEGRPERGEKEGEPGAAGPTPPRPGEVEEEDRERRRRGEELRHEAREVGEVHASPSR